MPLLVVLANVTAALGFGAMILNLLGLDKDMNSGEHWTLSFAIGFGALGWLVFPIGVAGLLSVEIIWLLLLLGSLGIFLLFKTRSLVIRNNLDAIGNVLLIFIFAVLCLDLAEALAPPADADSLAYHFNWPKRFISTGNISFIPQAWTGAVPMLVQMTYIPPLILGGETALTLWTMVVSWITAAMLFVFCRHHLSINWSLAISMIYLTIPAVVFGGGSGQVEPKMTLFVLASAWGLGRSLKTGRLSFAILTGLSAGFFAGAKYMGLLFVAATGMALLFRNGGLRPIFFSALAFGFAAVFGGFQWYAWNAFHTGDPIFPMFFEWLGHDDLKFWSADYSIWFKKTLRLLERDVPRSFWWLVGYPFKATFDPLVLFEARRTGFGPFGMLVLPFAVLGIWKLRTQILKSRLFPYAVVCALFYVLWFFTGSSQRIRHLLPVLPLFLVVMSVAAIRFADLEVLHKPLFAAVGTTLILQFLGHGIFSLTYIKHFSKDNSRDEFLSKNVLNYEVVPWINANLGSKDRIFLSERQVLYYLKVPYFFGSPNVQALVELRKGRMKPKTLYRQLRSVGVTHVLLHKKYRSDVDYEKNSWILLQKGGCLLNQKKFQLRDFKSRTLPNLGKSEKEIGIFTLNTTKCLYL